MVLFGLLDFENKVKNGLFVLPLSKENIIGNLQRITKKSKESIIKQLNEFIISFQNYINIPKPEIYTYYVSNNKYTHPPSRNPCPDPKNSIQYFILKSEFQELSKKSLINQSIDSQELFKKLILKTNNIKDLLYLCILKYITNKNQYDKYYTFDKSIIFEEYISRIKAQDDINKILEEANVDQDLIDYFSSFESLKSEKIAQMLSSNQNIFTIFYSHDFNSSSCVRRNNIKIRKDIAHILYEELDTIPFSEIIKNQFKKVKEKFLTESDRLPLFEIKSYKYKFLQEYYFKIINRNVSLYTFQINNDYKKGLDYFKNKNYININSNDEIFLRDEFEDKFRALFESLREKENRRIQKNKYDMLKELLEAKVNIRSTNRQEDISIVQAYFKEEESLKPETEAIIEDIIVLKGGDWKIVGSQSIFHYKVKVKNISPYTINNMQVVLTSIPPGLELKSNKIYEIANLGANSFVSPTFELVATQNCVGNRIEGIITYKDYKGVSKVKNIEPLEIKYVCSLLVPKEISNQEFQQKTAFMHEKKIMFDCKMEPIELEKILLKILQKNNFFPLFQTSQNDQFREMKAFAEGKYDKEEIGLSFIMQKLEEYTQLQIKGMSNLEDKIIDVLREINEYCIEIKTDTELIKDYMPLVEEILTKMEQNKEQLENYLKKYLSTDWEKIKESWQAYKSGEIGKRELIKRGIKGLSSKFIKALISFKF